MRTARVADDDHGFIVDLGGCRGVPLPAPQARFVPVTEPGMIGKMRGRNDLNAMSRRSSSDLVSLSSFLRSSSAFRLTGLRTGAHLFFRSRNLSCAIGGSVQSIFSSFRLLISLPPCRKHSRLRRRGASQHP